MADRVMPGPVDCPASIREAVCVHTKKIYSGCRDKDCIEDLRVYPTESSRGFIDTACSIRPRSAELLFAKVGVEEISFNRGYYTVDVSYFYRIDGETFPGSHPVSGLAVFDKRVILFGGEGSAKVYYSDTPPSPEIPRSPVQPVAVVESVNPIALSMRVVDRSCACGCDAAPEVPGSVPAFFGEELDINESKRLWYVTLGQFSLIRLERESQLIIPVYDYCIPENDCSGSCDDDPCTLFGRIPFPVEEFYPADGPEKDGCGCPKT